MLVSRLDIHASIKVEYLCLVSICYKLKQKMTKWKNNHIDIFSLIQSLRLKLKLWLERPWAKKSAVTMGPMVLTLHNSPDNVKKKRDIYDIEVSFCNSCRAKQMHWTDKITPRVRTYFWFTIQYWFDDTNQEKNKGELYWYWSRLSLTGIGSDPQPNYRKKNRNRLKSEFGSGPDKISVGTGSELFLFLFL